MKRLLLITACVTASATFAVAAALAHHPTNPLVDVLTVCGLWALTASLGLAYTLQARKGL